MGNGQQPQPIGERGNPVSRVESNALLRQRRGFDAHRRNQFAYRSKNPFEDRY